MANFICWSFVHYNKPSLEYSKVMNAVSAIHLVNALNKRKKMNKERRTGIFIGREIDVLCLSSPL